MIETSSSEKATNRMQTHKKKFKYFLISSFLPHSARALAGCSLLNFMCRILGARKKKQVYQLCTSSIFNSNHALPRYYDSAAQPPYSFNERERERTLDDEVEQTTYLQSIYNSTGIHSGGHVHCKMEEININFIRLESLFFFASDPHGRLSAFWRGWVERLTRISNLITSSQASIPAAKGISNPCLRHTDVLSFIRIEFGLVQHLPVLDQISYCGFWAPVGGELERVFEKWMRWAVYNKFV